jgi:multiple sugar transport system substrate-binding protein
MKRTERVALSLLALVLIASMILSACAPAPAPAPVQQPAAAAATKAPAAAEPTKAPAAAAKPFPTEPVTISIWGGFPEIQPVYEAAAAEYKKLHPNVTVTVLTAALRDFEQKMAATIPADSAGDILEANPFAIQKFIVADLLPPVPDDLVQWMTAEGRYNEALVKNNLYNGKYYGVPYLVGRHAIYYNTDMFAAAGLPAEGPKTMDDLRNYAKKLAKYDAAGNLTTSGISLRLSGAGSGIAEKFWMYLYPMGGSLVEQTKSGKWHNNYNNEAGLNTLQWYLDIVYKDKTNNPQITADTAGFSQGVAAMYARESSPIGAIAKNAPNLKYATVPMPKGVRWGDLANGENLYVSKNSKYPEVAWDFVKFLESDRWLQELLKVSGWLPQRRDADLKEILAGQPAYKAFLFSDPEYKLYVYPTALPEYDEIQTKMATRLTNLYLQPNLATDQAALKKALAEMAQETDDILKREGHYGTD